MAHLMPVLTLEGKAGSDNDDSDAATDAEGHGAAPKNSLNTTAPILHKIQSQRSILALLVSNFKLYAGAQNGDLLVRYSVIENIKSRPLTRGRCGPWKHMSYSPPSMRIEAASSVSAYLPTNASSSQALEMPLSMYRIPLSTVFRLTDTSRSGVQRLSIDSIPYTPRMTLGMSSRLSTHRICRLSS